MPTIHALLPSGSINPVAFPSLYLVAEKVSVHELGAEVDALHEALQCLRVLGAHQLQNAEEPDGQELAVQDAA